MEVMYFEVCQKFNQRLKINNKIKKKRYKTYVFGNNWQLELFALIWFDKINILFLFASYINNGVIFPKENLSSRKKLFLLDWIYLNWTKNE